MSTNNYAVLCTKSGGFGSRTSMAHITLAGVYTIDAPLLGYGGFAWKVYPEPNCGRGLKTSTFVCKLKCFILMLVHEYNDSTNTT